LLCYDFFMNTRILLIAVLIVIAISGCSFFQKKELDVAAEEVAYVNSGKVIEQAVLKKGGKLLIVPFSAGVNVAATNEMDKVALGIVKGIYDVVGGGKSSFEILNVDNASEAEVVIKGHITQMVAPKKGFTKWFKMGKKKKVLAAEGKMIAKDTGQIVLVFSHSRETKIKDQSLVDLGVLLGQDIGKFILSEI